MLNFSLKVCDDGICRNLDKVLDTDSLTAGRFAKKYVDATEKEVSGVNSSDEGL